MQNYLYDDRNVEWQIVEAIDAQIHVLAIDDALGIVDVLIRLRTCQVMIAATMHLLHTQLTFLKKVQL